MKSICLLIISLTILPYFTQGQTFLPDDYCLVWSDEFNVDGAPNSANWNFEQGYVRNKEAQYYTRGRLENARVEKGRLIVEAREDNWNGNQYTSASLVSSGKVAYQFGRFEIRAKIDVRPGSWPAFWTLGQSGEWPSNGEIDIMEYYAGKIHANVAWGTGTRYQAKWDSQNKEAAGFPKGWVDSFHVWRMEWTPQFIKLYVDDILMNTTDLSQTINDNTSPVRNPFLQKHYIILNQAIGGINGGDPSGTKFPVKYEVDYVRVYQMGSCKLDCNWQEGGNAFLDKCQTCVGGNTNKKECQPTCNGNLISNPGFEENSATSAWDGWGIRNIVTGNSYAGQSSMAVGNGATEQLIDVLPNTKYILKVQGKKSGAGWYRLGVKEYGGIENYVEATNTTWNEKMLTFITGNVSTARIYFYNGGGGTAYGDNFALQPLGCLVTGIDDIHSEYEQIELYPNPSDKIFFIRAPESGNILVYNSKGQLLLNSSIAAGSQFGETFPSGVYKIYFSSKNYQKNFTWVKN